MQLPIQARGLSFHPASTKMTIAEPPYRPGLANARLANAGQVAYSQSPRELLPSTDAPIAEQPHPPRPLRSLTIAKTMTGGMKPTSMIKHATSAPSFNATSKICQETRASRLAPAGRRLPLSRNRVQQESLVGGSVGHIPARRRWHKRPHDWRSA